MNTEESNNQEYGPNPLEYFTAMMKSLRDDYSDEIPKKMVQSHHANNKYKCRGGWITDLGLNIDLMVRAGLLPPEYSENKYDRVFSTWKETLINDEYEVLPENVAEANKLLADVIKYLEQNQQAKTSD